MAGKESVDIAADEGQITLILTDDSNTDVQNEVFTECLDILVTLLNNNTHAEDLVVQEVTDANLTFEEVATTPERTIVLPTDSDTVNIGEAPSSSDVENIQHPTDTEGTIAATDSGMVNIDKGPSSSDVENIQHPTDTEGTIAATDSGMVNIDEGHSSSDTENIPPPTDTEGLRKRGRKRTRQPDTWERNIRKTKRQKGEEYVNSKGKLVPAKAMSVVDCSTCYAKCSEKIDDESRKRIFQQFWSLEDSDKSTFYAKFTEKKVKERKRTKANSSRKDYSFLYFLESHGIRHRVCKNFFLATLGISQSRINYFYSHLTNSDTGTPTARKQGKFKKREIPVSELEFVRDHISSFPVIESHYCREKTKRQYLEQNLNLSILYDLYREKCTEAGREPVKAHKYRQIFNEEFNLGFIKPKSDRCDTCEQHKMDTQKGKVFSEDERAQIERHQFLKSDAYEERERDRKSNSAVLCFDLENVISLPRANVSNFYYRRKLSVYNLTVHCSLDKNVYCSVWNEAESGRGGNAIASALLKALRRFVQDHPDVSEIILWSDSCVPQNRNSFMSYALMSFMKKYPHINKITQKFSESGHSMIQEVDNAHSSIERHLRACEVYSPISLIRQLLFVRRNPKLIVLQMKQDDFLCFDRTKNLNFNKVPFNSVKQLKYEKGKLNFVSYKDCHKPEKEMSCILILKDKRTTRGRVHIKPQEVVPLQNLATLKPTNLLSKEKLADLTAMYAYMPPVDVQCFEAILKLCKTARKALIL